MYKMLAFTIKYWLVAIPFLVLALLFVLITFLSSLLSDCLSIVVGCSLLIFWCFLIVNFITEYSFWRDLYVWSVEKKLNIKIQNFLKFLKEN